MHMQLEDR